MAPKPTKQQIAQAVVRAGGNNPIKVTNSGLKKLGSVVAASLLPVSRAVEVAAAGVKAVRVAKVAKENTATYKKVTQKIVDKNQTAQVRANSVKVVGKEPRYTTPSKEFTPINIASAGRAAAKRARGK